MPSSDRFTSFRHCSRSGLSGFTIAELLVVIGIIGLLLAILLPVLNLARQSALQVACASNQAAVSRAMLGRAAEHQGYLSLVGQIDLPAQVGPNHDLPALLADPDRARYDYAIEPGLPSPTYRTLSPLPVAVARYLDSATFASVEFDDAELRLLADSPLADVFRCPASDVDAASDFRSPPHAVAVGGLPHVKHSDLQLDYAFNTGVMGFHHDRAHEDRRLRGLLTRARDSVEIVLFGDSDTSGLGEQTMTWTPALDPELEATLASVVERTGSIDLLPQHRHRGMINLAFADGHVASLDSSDPGALTRTRLLPIR